MRWEGIIGAHYETDCNGDARDSKCFSGSDDGWRYRLGRRCRIPSLLGAAVEAGDIGAARSWLDQGMDPNMEADRVGTSLMIGAWEGNIAMMELFASRGADVNRVNRYGEQALQLAAWRGNLDAVRWLLDHGASTRRKGKDWSAMHYAVVRRPRRHRAACCWIMAPTSMPARRTTRRC